MTIILQQIKFKKRDYLNRGVMIYEISNNLLLSSFCLISFSMLLLPTSSTAQSLSFSGISYISGKNIINYPNRNSSSGVPNMPYVEIPENQVRGIGDVCEHDADCGNFSICILKLREDDTAVKLCGCDPHEMFKVNQTCFVKPGHQCYFPNMNSHGYRFIECLSGSTCLKSVVSSKPEDGFCMCDLGRRRQKIRQNLNAEFEMATCRASLSSFASFTSLIGVLLLFIC